MKTTHFRLLLAIMLLCQAITTIAVPAYPGLTTVKQPDGTTVSLYLKGDEKVHWMESEDGYTLMYDSEKNIVYAEQDSKGDMIPSSVKYIQSPKQIPVSFKKGLRYSSSQVNKFMQKWKIDPESNLRSLQQQQSVVGNKKALCVLMDFPNKEFSKTPAEFDQLMNQVGYSVGTARGSVKDYYKENSYGKMDLSVTVVGPFTTDNPISYYVSQANDEGYKMFAKEAIEKASSAGVDLKEFANDRNELESFHIIYAGYGDEAVQDGQQIWAHKWSFPTITLKGVKVSVYSCSPELRGSSGSNITHIGVICHELCHVFGAPDFYDANDDDSGGNFSGTGNWDLMANGSWNNSGVTPAHINMYQKIQFGWVNPEVLANPKEITNMPNSAENEVAYRFNTSTSGEYFILENRQKIGFDRYIPGTGLIIYHVSITNADIYNNTVNIKHPQRVYPVCASANTNPTGTPKSYGSINSSGCPFPGFSNNTSFTDYTVPSATSWNGSNSFKPITEIQEQNSKISFRFMMPDAEPVTNLNVTAENQNVNITWNKPSDNVVAYNIYRNNILLIKLMGKDNTSYSQLNVSAGYYNYCVTACYDNNKESARVCKEVKVNSQIDGSYLSVKNLEARNINNNKDIELKWQSPFISDWITHSGELWGWSAFENTKFTSVVRYTTDDLQRFQGSKLTKVRFSIYNLQCKHTIQVWLKDSNNSPFPSGDPIVNQEITNPTKSNNFEVELVKPVDIASNKELWIGIQYELSPMTAVMGVDNGPKVPDRNYVFINNTWYNISNDLNLFIFGYLQFDGNFLKAPADSWLRSTSATATQYVIYRDNKIIATTTQSSYVDPEPPLGSHIYCVSIVYDDGKESEPVCIEAFSSNNSFFDPVNDLSGYVENQNVKLTWNKPSEDVTAYNIYRNDLLLTTITGKDNTSYTQYNVEQGEYNYCVTAVYKSDESEPVCIDVVIFEPKPVTNLLVKAENQNVILTWDKPSEDVTAYNIYRNDLLLITLWGKDNTTYNQINVNSGNHNYCVTAKYNEYESNPLCKEIEVSSQIYETYQSVQNLEAQNVNNDRDIELNWESPFVSDWVTFAKDLWGWRDYKDVDQFVSIVRFTTNDLKRYQGSKLTKVRFSIHNLECKYAIQVWVTDKGNEPSGDPIVNQSVNDPADTDNFFEVTIDTPVDLEFDKELWIGIKYEMNPMAAVAGTDNGPKLSGRNYYYINGQLNETSSNDDFNWFISGYMQFDDNQLNATASNWLRTTNAVATNYVVYRDGNIIATTNKSNYIDTQPPFGSHIYCVAIAYDDGKESEPVCIEAFSSNNTSIIPVYDLVGEIEVYPNPIQKGEVLVIRFDSQAVSILSLYNISGQIIQQEQITGGIVYKKMDFEPGIYLLQIKNDSNTLIRKIIIK